MTGPDEEPQAPQLSPGDQLRWCINNLGGQIATVVVRPEALTADLVKRWHEAPDSIPKINRDRTAILYSAARRVRERHGNHAARQFLLASQSDTDDDSLLDVIGAESPKLATYLVGNALESLLTDH